MDPNPWSPHYRLRVSLFDNYPWLDLGKNHGIVGWHIPLGMCFYLINTITVMFMFILLAEFPDNNNIERIQLVWAIEHENLYCLTSICSFSMIQTRITQVSPKQNSTPYLTLVMHNFIRTKKKIFRVQRQLQAKKTIFRTLKIGQATSFSWALIVFSGLLQYLNAFTC